MAMAADPKHVQEIDWVNADPDTVSKTTEPATNEEG